MTPIKIVLFSATLAFVLAFTLHRMSLMRPSRAAEDNPLNYSYWPALPKADKEPMRIAPPLPVPEQPRAGAEPLMPTHSRDGNGGRTVGSIPATGANDGICARYNLHKVWTANGKSWRCRPH